MWPGFAASTYLVRRTRCPRGLLFSLRDLLSASGVFLLLALDVRLVLFLRSLLAFSFWRFVAHEPKAKV